MTERVVACLGFERLPRDDLDTGERSAAKSGGCLRGVRGRNAEPHLVRPADARHLGVDRDTESADVTDHRLTFGAGKAVDDRGHAHRDGAAPDRERQRSAHATREGRKPRSRKH